MALLTPEGDIAAWLVGQTFNAFNIGTFDGTPATGTPPSLSINGSDYNGSIGYIFQLQSGGGQLVSETFYNADPSTARVEYRLNYADGSHSQPYSTQVIAYSATQILTEGYGYTSDYTAGCTQPGGCFLSDVQSPGYYAVYSLTPLTAQDAAYDAGSTVASFNFPSTGSSPIPEPSGVVLVAVAVVAIVALRALRGLRGKPAVA
jgi:hypothetical protein